MWESDSPPSRRPDWRTMSDRAGLDERELRSACRRRRYARGETIFHEGDPTGALHLLDIGHVSVGLTTLEGDVSIVEVLRPGDTFGERVLVDDGSERSASVTAIDRVETLSLDPSRAKSLLESPGFDRFLLLVVGGRLLETTRQLLEARHVHADQRLFRCLVRLAAQFTETPPLVGPLTIPLTQADIASMVGITRSTANRLLRDAQDDGVLDIGRGRITVIDADALHRLAGKV